MFSNAIAAQNCRLKTVYVATRSQWEPLEIASVMRVLDRCDRLERLEFSIQSSKQTAITSADIWRRLPHFTVLQSLSFAIPSNEVSVVVDTLPKCQSLQSLTIRRFDTGSEAALKKAFEPDKRMVGQITRLEVHTLGPLLSPLPFIGQNFHRLQSLALLEEEVRPAGIGFHHLPESDS